MTESHLELRLPDPSLVLLIGPSGAGKSTFAARHFRPTEIVSSDRCRALICDNEEDQTVSAAAFGLLHHLTRERLKLRCLTVIDATNLQFRARRPLHRIARSCRVPLVAVVFNVALETCLRHNRARPQRIVPETAIRQHWLELKATRVQLVGESCAAIFTLNETDAESVRILRINTLKADNF